MRPLGLQVLGPNANAGEVRQTRLLNRMITWGDRGIEWEAVYHGLPPMEWYSVYGNHDYGTHPHKQQCACRLDDESGTKSCAQVQKHGVTMSVTDRY